MRKIVLALLLIASTATFTHADSQRPSSVGGLIVEAIGSDAIRIEWDEPWDDEGVKGYNIYRNGQYYLTVYDTQYTDNAVSPGSRYSYSIVAFDYAKNFSKKRVELSATTDNTKARSADRSSDSDRPGTPGSLSADIESSSTARIHWQASTGNIRGYNVYRDGKYLVSVKQTEFRDSSLNWGQDYSYAIVAYDYNKQFSKKTNSLLVNTSDDDSHDDNNKNDDDDRSESANDNRESEPSQPSGLYAEIKNSNEATIRWQDSTGDIRGYNVYRDGNYVATVRDNRYNDPGLRWDRDYQYYEIAYSNSKAFSEKSKVLTVNTADDDERSASEDSDIVYNDGQGNNDVRDGYAPSGYNLVFNDEFQTRGIDSSKWNTTYRWGSYIIINGEKQFYVDVINQPDFGHSPFEFDGEYLTINAVPTPDYLRSSANWQKYMSGALTTYEKFKMRYGYVEMRASMPKGRGLWSAFWLLHQKDDQRRPEIDVMEFLGHRPDRIYNTYHYYKDGNLNSTPSFEVREDNFSDDMHTFGMEWEPGKITWSVDGEERNSFESGNVSWEDMYLLVNLAVGGWWPGDPDENTRFPAQYKIDYIRAYQKD